MKFWILAALLAVGLFVSPAGNVSAMPVYEPCQVQFVTPSGVTSTFLKPGLCDPVVIVN